jgi:hypothetical protein
MYEEDDSVFRDIDIKPIHSMSDLEAVIQSAYNLPGTGSGAFYKSNDNWQRGKEVHPGPPKKEEKKGKSRAVAIPGIVSFIDDPHQHFIYEYKGSQEFIFLIELMSVGGKEDFKTNYPLCIRTQGASPFKKEESVVHFTKHVVPVPQDEAEEEEEEESADEAPPAVVNEEEAEEELEVTDGGEGDDSGGRDLMDGDAIEETDEEEGTDEAFDDESDDFSSDDFNDGGDDFDDEELR